jgi:hypothetical protein
MCNLMEVFMKTRFAIIGIVIVLAVSLLTCELDFPGKGGVEEDLDWEFVELPSGNAQLTLWLDGTKPVKAATANRALNLGIAKRSHDFFEAVFILPGATPADLVVARSNWEIGQAAGIRGVPRGVKYYGVSPTPATGTGSSMVLVGRKIGSGGEGTLLGVGYMTHVDGLPIATAAGTGVSDGTIAANTRNVTFTVSAMSTRIGYDFSIPNTHDSWSTTYDPLRDTFVTAAKATPATAVNNVTNASIDNTLIGTAIFKNEATYSMFGLPEFTSTSLGAAVDINDGAVPAKPVDMAKIVAAKYTVGGFLVPAGTGVGQVGESGATVYSGPLDLAEGLFVADCKPENNFQVIERLAIYQTLGQTHDVIEADLDTVTTVVPSSTYKAATASGEPFDPNIELEFQIRPKSSGAFAFTFQIPVYALAKGPAPAVITDPGPFPAPSTNGGPEAVYWYVRPAHGQQQYLLDNGQTSGGAVLMGVGVGSLDWLEILVWGFGFKQPNRPAPPATP